MFGNDAAVQLNKAWLKQCYCSITHVQRQKKTSRFLNAKALFSSCPVVWTLLKVRNGNRFIVTIGRTLGTSQIIARGRKGQNMGPVDF